MLHWLSLAVLVAGLLSAGPAGIRAQDSTAVCLSSFGWMSNSRSQSPCVVAAYLHVACTGAGEYTLTPLPVGYQYRGPYTDELNTCQCSTVMYSMMSACGLCQNGSIVSWTSWAFNCTTVYPEIFPQGIPAGTAVPHWAYQNVMPNGTFNATLAQSLGDNPESTATVAQSTVSVVSTSTSPLPTISTSPSISPAGSSSSNTNAGAIAGGVVGGVVGVALIAAVAVFFIMRKRRSQIPPSATVSPYTQPKVYDPSDPSTFPLVSRRPLPTTVTRSTANVPTSFYTSNIPSLRPGDGRAYYTCVPEV